MNKKITPVRSLFTTGQNGLMLKIVTSYSIFLMVILILFVVLYRNSINNAKVPYNTQNQLTTIKDIEFFEEDFQIMEMYCRQILQNTNFRAIMNMSNTSEIFFERGRSVKNTLSTDILAETLLPIKEVFCYLPLTDYVLSAGNFASSDFYYNKIRIFPAEEYDNWKSTLNNTDLYGTFVDMSIWTPHSLKDQYMYIIDLGDLYFTDVNAIVCFIVDSEKMSERFSLIDSFGPSGYMKVLDEEGKTIFTLGNTSMVIDDSLFPATRNSFVEQNIGLRTLTLSTYHSEETGYTYHFTFPSYQATKSVATNQGMILTLTFVALVAGVLLVILFSRMSYHPIVELGQELNEAVEEKDQLQEVVNKQKPIITTSYIRQLLKGTISSEDEAEYIKNYLNLENNLSYNVLYMVAYNNSENNLESTSITEPLDEETIEHVMQEAMEKFFPQPFYCYSPAARSYAVLLSTDDPDSNTLIMKAQETTIRLHDYLLDQYGIWMFAGIGYCTNSLTNVWESYQQATEAVSYTTKNYIFYPYEFIKKDSNIFYYPPEISAKLIHFITTGNTAQVLELFNLIHQENIEQRALPLNLLKFLLSDIRNSLLKARFNLPSGTDPETVALLDNRFGEHLSFKLCEDLALTLCKLFSSDSEDADLATTIEKYIIQNYKDPSMSLNKISDEFQISESYFSHMFKEKTGVNFSTYLENIRMTEAARLIQETDISLNELYFAVGYNNPNSFRRVFKKVFGVTPSSMRESK
ncbi:MAG: helix-turn-helix transcriptional regulator [Lachnospiraceae bacterium]|nr:helix-turn-helix transcriptional regulator [Lachnospiraceae bacterium]